MRNYTINSIKNNVVLSREQLHAEHDAQFDARQAADTADFDLIGPALESLFDSMPKCSAFPTGTLVMAAYEASLDALKAEGKTPTMPEKAALQARLGVTVPEYVKSNPDQLHTSRKAGVRVRFSNSENANGADPRISDEEWAKIVEVKEKAPKTDKSEA